MTRTPAAAAGRPGGTIADAGLMATVRCKLGRRKPGRRKPGRRD
ncbi:hypothetical protein [Ferrovibrio xuzhouensis]|uniref:Uncharacterized protein n=1 Tax=Ferrovibrio xuzhouensis TaxID=1576914 RepID=A0ABV7VJK3_9PROT